MDLLNRPWREIERQKRRERVALLLALVIYALGFLTFGAVLGWGLARITTRQPTTRPMQNETKSTNTIPAAPAPAKTGTGRPKQGYFNKAGKRVPGVTTILGRFKEAGGLIQWAYQCGRDGIDINEARDRAADAGTCCHEMIDAHLHGRKFDRASYPPEVLGKADHAFLAFLEWAEQSKLAMAASEVSLVSEKYQFGGTFDGAFVAGTLRLLDYKTSAGIYTDQVIQVAGGYAILWAEHYPDKPLYGIDILRVSKPSAPDDPVSFEHRHFSAEIIPIAQKQFVLLREAYDLDKRIKGLL